MTKPIATVIQKPLIALIVDGGRVGKQHLGFTPSGPLDWFAFTANAKLLGNSDEQAQIEIVQGELRLYVNSSAIFSAVGKAIAVRKNNTLIPLYSRIQTKPGDILSISTTSEGSVCYLGVVNGFESSVANGSRCTVMREHSGGLHNDGMPLSVGDVLKACMTKPLLTTDNVFAQENELAALHNQIYGSNVLHVIKGNQVPGIGEHVWHLFLTEQYAVSNQYNRMGYKLSGKPLPAPSVAMRSEAMTIGAIQVPPDGQPIIMMADHQTLGGYPKIGSIALCDLPRLSQATAGTVFKFLPINVDEARFRYRQLYKRLHNVVRRNEQFDIKEKT